MRPTWDYKDFGSTAFLNDKTLSDNPYREQSLAHLQWLQGFLSEHLMVTQDKDHLKYSDLLIDLEDVKYWTSQLASRLKRELPSAEDVSKAIKIDLSLWPKNCYGIAQATLESGVLDAFQQKYGKLFLTYGQYHGEFAPTSIYANRPLARHAWLESPLGHIVDPTRYVFLDQAPHLWSGVIDDYDLSGARIREEMSPNPPIIRDKDSNLLKIPLNNPSSLSVFDRILKNVNHEIEKSGQIELCHLIWVATRPLEILGKDAPMIVNAIDMMGKSYFVPIDNRNWIAEVSEWRESIAHTVKP